MNFRCQVDGGLKGFVVKVLFEYEILILQLNILTSLKRERRVGLAWVGMDFKPFPNVIFWCVENSTMDRFLMNCLLCKAQSVISLVSICLDADVQSVLITLVFLGSCGGVELLVLRLSLRSPLSFGR